MTRFFVAAACTIMASICFAEGWLCLGSIWAIAAALNGILFAVAR